MKSLPERMLNIKGVFKGKDAVGLELAGNNLKLVHLSAAKNAVVGLISKDIEGLSDDDISQFIIDILSTDFKLKKPGVIISIPSHLVTTKNIELPSSDPKEIEEIITLQAGRHTPYSKEEIILDYIITGRYREKYTKVLLVIVHKLEVNRTIDILKGANLEAEKIFFAPESIAHWYHLVSKIHKDKDRSLVGIFHISFKFTDFIVILAGKPIFVRTIPLGKEHFLKEKEKFPARFKKEVEDSLGAYEKEGVEAQPQRLLLTGAVDELESLESFLKAELTLSIDTIPYFENLRILEKVTMIAEAEAKNTSFLPVIVSPLAQKVNKVNLIPEEVRIRKALEKKGREIFKMGMWIMVVFIFIWGNFLAKIYTKNFFLKRLKSEYGTINKEAESLKIAMAKVMTIKSYLAFRNEPLEVLRELCRVLPQAVYLTNITFQRKKIFNIKGTSESMAEVFSFVSILEASPYFESVKLKYTRKRKEENKDLADFEIGSVLGRPSPPM